MPGIPSEQNWQSQGHPFLSHVVAETDTDIWTYRLQTVVLPPQEQVAVFVKYTRKGAAPTTREFIGGKRDMMTSGEAVFGVFNTSAQFNLEIPQGHTAEGVIRLHQRSGLRSHHALTKTLPLHGAFDHFELRQNIRTARRMLKSGSPWLQDERFNVSTTKQRQTEAIGLQNTTSTVQDLIIAHGPAQRDPRVDPPVPILQIGLEYTLQDTYYTTSNNSRLSKRQALKKSCKHSTTRRRGQHVDTLTFLSKAVLVVLVPITRAATPTVSVATVRIIARPQRLSRASPIATRLLCVADILCMVPRNVA